MCLEVAGLRSVVNITKIVLSNVITVLTVVLESTYYEIVPQPNIRTRVLKNERPKFCRNCRYDFKRNVNNVNVNNILSYKACNLVYFCDEDCKRKKWKQHQIPCKSIITLPKQRRDKVMHAGTYSSVLSVKDEAKVTSLVGESCLIDFQLNGQVTSLLLDTGAQMSIIDMEDLKNYHLNTVVRSLEEILGNCNSFCVQWGDTAGVGLI